MLEKTKATISKDSPRYDEWIKVFGTDTIPLLSPIPEPASGPGTGRALFYHLDTDALDEDQRRRLVEHLARKFKLREDLVWRDLGQVGCPILADDLIVVMDSRLL
ncbi:MAG TPA: hypothetical protein VID27_06080 [Blastocatellia bacterium]|jgi:hypothetical protein